MHRKEDEILSTPHVFLDPIDISEVAQNYQSFSV